MASLALLVALAALGLSIFAIRIAKQAGGGAPMRAPPNRNFTISGKIRVTNKCDGQQASIPNQVIVGSALEDEDAKNSVSGTDTVNLGPDPDKPNDPEKIGTYSITVPWPPGVGKAHHWNSPKVVVKVPDPDNPGQTIRIPVCEVIKSCDAPKVCKNNATGSRIILVGGGQNVSYDIRVVCTCIDR
jgi:hypothetical protein